MAQYYFVGTLLPALSLESVPEITFGELDRLFRDNLSERDYEKVLAIRRFYDILNIRSFWLEEKLDARGEMDPLELGEAIASRVGIPDYVHEFINRYPKTEDRLHHFPSLLAHFFQSGAKLKDSFLRQYFMFERELRLITTAYRARKLGRNLSTEFQYENPEEDLIAQLLAQQDAINYELPEKYNALIDIFEKYGDQPLALKKALDRYRFETIESFVDMADDFSIERMLAYFCQLLIVEQWVEMDKTKGIQIVEAIINAR